jgi:tetratricopeptide (TPR) repeat protein
MNKPIKILFLAANPKDTGQLRLDEEIRGIKQALRQAEFRDKFDIEQEWAVRVTELQGHLLNHKPDIVHFSGHGSKASEIILEDHDGFSQTVPARALSQLFKLLKDNIRCVVLNACYSKNQAEAIAKHIGCVVGMSKAIGDEAAINFAIAFYQALGYGKDVKTAFELGRVQIDLKRINEKDTPKLLALKSDPKKVVFVKKSSVVQSRPKVASAKKKSPQLKSIEFLKILEKQRISQEAREKVQDAIDILKLAGISMMVLGQQETSALKIKLLSPVNTAMRWPFAFRWRLETKDSEFYEKSKLKLLLKIFESSQHAIFAQEVTGKDFLEIPVVLQEKLAKGQWYRWRVEAFNEKGELVGTCATKDNNIEIDPEFQVFAQEDVLKSLLDKYSAFAIKQEKAGFNPHVVLGAIYQSLLLRDEAVNEYGKAIEKEPTEKYLYERAIAVLQQQGLSEEIVLLKQSLKATTKN